MFVTVRVAAQQFYDMGMLDEPQDGEISQLQIVVAFARRSGLELFPHNLDHLCQEDCAATGKPYQLKTRAIAHLPVGSTPLQKYDGRAQL